MKIVEKEIDLSILKPKIGVLIPGTRLELAIIRYYKLVVDKDSNMVTDINNYIANKLYNTKDKKYSYSDLMERVDEKHYNNVMFKFIGYLETILLNHTTPDVIDIKFHSVVDLNSMLFKFEYRYNE